MTPETATRLDAALGLAAQGFLIGHCYGVTPAGVCGCGCDDPGCKKRGKHGGKDWMKQATQDPEVIRTRFMSGDPNFMVVPPPGLRLLIVDEDMPGSLEALGELPQTFIVETSVKPGGARGRHVYGKLPDGIDEADLHYQWDGGQIRFASNGGVVGPHSRHASGVTYDPMNELEVKTLELEWVRNLIASGRQRTKAQDEARGPDDEGWIVTEPGRHPWLISKAGKLRRDGLDGDALRDALRHLNVRRCRPPLPDDEVDDIASWADGKEGDPGPGPQADNPRLTPRNVGASLPPPNVDDWVIEGVLRPGAILIVASPEGLGKSYIRKEMAARLTTCGGSLFGHYPVPRSSTVLEIDEENGEAEEFRREEQVFAALGVDRGDAANYWSASFPALDLEDEGARLALREQLAATKPGVLMLDTGTSMVGDEWGPDFKKVMRFLRSLAVAFGCAIVVFVHLVKPARGKERPARTHGLSISDVMGQWTRLADAVALLADLGDGRAMWSMFKKVPKSQLVIAQADGLWKVVHVGAEHRVTTDDRVLRAIAAGGTSPEDIGKSLDVSKRTVSASIKKLRNEGLLEVGFPYKLTDVGRESLP